MQALLTDLPARLFPEGYSSLDEVELVHVVNLLTRHLNEALKFYSTLASAPVEHRLKFKPTLLYAEAVLSQACRLLKFDGEQLTPQNQLVADLADMLRNREKLIRLKYDPMARRELALISDPRLRRMLELALLSHLR
ncbi:MAG: hypothetical protein Kow0069_39300 [Promethearchaeota archaeon]